MPYLLLASRWLGYGALHSLLAGNATKNRISRRTGGFFVFTGSFTPPLPWQD